MHVDKISGQGKKHLEGVDGIVLWCQGQKQCLFLTARLKNINAYNSWVYPFPEADVTDKLKP